MIVESVIIQRETVVVEKDNVTVVSVGVQGPEGAAAGTVIGGYAVTVSGVINKDLLSFDSATGTWRNRPAIELTDGGNF